jgi:hypothetical protein
MTFRSSGMSADGKINVIAQLQKQAIKDIIQQKSCIFEN